MTQIKITADNSQALKGIEEIERALGAIQKTTALASKALAVTTAALGGFAFGVKQVIDNVGAQEDLAKALGTTGRELNYLQQSAQLAGVSAGELGSALMRLQGNIGEAFVSGTGPAVEAIERLGLSVTNLSQLPADKQLAEITAALIEIKNPAERAALAVDLLGKQGPRLLEVGLRAADLKREAEQMGLALSAVDVRSIERAGDAMDEISFITSGFIKKLVAELAPIIIVIAEKIKEAVKEMGGMEFVIDAVIRGFKLLVQVTAALMAYIAVAKIAAIVLMFGKFALQVAAVAKTFRTLGIAAAASQALATGGLSAMVTLTAGVAGAIAAGVAAGAAMDSMFEEARIVSAQVAEEVDTIPPAIKKASEEQERLNNLQKKAVETLREYVTGLERGTQQQQDALRYGQLEADIRKAIAEQEEKLLKAKLEMDPADRNRIRNALELSNTLKIEASITKDIISMENERLGLGIRDKDQREIVLAIRSKEVEFGRLLNNEERDRLSTAIRQTQIAKENAAIAEAIYESTRKQTELEKIQRGLNLKKTLDPATNNAEEYRKDQAALQTLLDTKLISQQSYFRQLEQLQTNYSVKAMEMESEQFRNFDRLNSMRIDLEAQRHAAALRNDTDLFGSRKFSEETIQQIATERANFEKKTDLDKTKFALDNMTTVFSALGASNKKAFEANKAFAIASAVINAYQGASKALATYPWPFGLVAAAAAVAAGFAQVSAIRSQQYQGRQLGGPVMGGQPYIVGENGPELFTPRNTGAITPNRQLGGDSGEVTVNFNIVANDTAGFDQLLSSRRGIITQIISDAMLERGQRSMI